MRPARVQHCAALHSALRSDGNAPNRYLAIYELETDEPDWTVENMFASVETGAMPLHPAFNVEATTMLLFEEFSDMVVAKPDA